MAYVVNTGLLTSLSAICTFVTVCELIHPEFRFADIVVLQYATMPNNYIFMGFYFSLSKRMRHSFTFIPQYEVRSLNFAVYFNSLLATLNARDLIRDGKTTRSLGTYSASSGVGAYPMPRIVTIGSASGAMKSLASSPPSSPVRGEFNFMEKVRSLIWRLIIIMLML